jgi:hypothetical protein
VRRKRKEEEPRLGTWSEATTAASTRPALFAFFADPSLVCNLFLQRNTRFDRQREREKELVFGRTANNSTTKREGEKRDRGEEGKMREMGGLRYDGCFYAEVGDKGAR